MTASEILEKQSEILDCAIAFRIDDNYIMKQLAEEYNFSLAAGESFPKEIYLHHYNTKGIFRNEWTYYFHGSHCRFENLETGQVVELLYIEKPEFGFINGFHLYNY